MGFDIASNAELKREFIVFYQEGFQFLPAGNNYDTTQFIGDHHESATGMDPVEVFPG